MRDHGIGDRIFDVINVIIMLALVFVTAYPMYYVVCASFSSHTTLIANPGMLFWPHQFTMGAYQLAFKHPLLIGAFRNSVTILLCALPINFILTLFCGYFMACKDMKWKKFVMAFLLFTMFFNGGLIPSYLNQRDLGLYNNLAALIIPAGLSIYNAIICRTAIQAIPDSLMESAYIDGANDFIILFRIIAPLIMPTTAVLLLYYGVGHWNSWFSASIYIVDNKLLPIQNILRALLLVNENLLDGGDTGQGGDNFDNYAETIKYAAVVITTLPILCIYPFLQKYFIKGVMIGAVKG